MKYLLNSIILILIFSTYIIAQEEPIKDSSSSKRYLNMTQIETSYGSSNELLANTFAIQNTHNLQFKDHFFIGLGHGFDFHVKRATVFPFFARIGAILTKKKVSPIIMQDIGYAFGIAKSNPYSYYYIEDELGHGFYANSFIGVHLKTQKKIAFQLGFSYKFQQLSFDVPTYDFFTSDFAYIPQQKVSMQRIGIKMGFSF